MDEKAALAQLDDDIAYLAERIERAIVVPPPPPPWTRVNVGATVSAMDEQGQRHDVTLVGEDETDVANARVSWCSPLGRALMHQHLDDEVLWQRPVGDLSLVIVAIEYREHDD